MAIAIASYDPSPALSVHQWHRMAVLLLLLFGFLLASVAAESAGAGMHESASSAARLRGRMAIVNGQEAFDQRYFAHQVAVFDEGSFICGGSIISPNHILTSAHAFSMSVHLREFEQTNDSSVFLKKYHKFDTDPKAKTNYWEVGYGSLTANDYNSATSKKVRVVEGWINKNYVFNLTIEESNGTFINYDRRSNDIAVLHVVSPLIFSDTVRSISLSPYDSYLQPGHDLTVSGWGSMLTGIGPLPRKLQALTVDHRPEFCDELFNNGAYTLLPLDSLLHYNVWYDRNEMLCAGCPQLGSGVGGGDSGGALTVRPANGGCPVEIAIVQATYVINRTTLGMLGFDLYARISSHLDWIEHVVKQPLRSTVVPVPTRHCETCLGNDHPGGQECEKAQKYDLNYCEVQARLASSFVLEEPTCEGGKHKLKAHMDIAKGLAGLSSSSMANAKEQLEKGHVIFLVTNMGIGNGVIHISPSADSHMDHVDRNSSHKSSLGVKKAEAIAINTPLKMPELASKMVSFDTKEEGWVHLVGSGCSSKSTYAALYIVTVLFQHSGPDHAAASKHAHYQISLPVGTVPLP